MAKTVKEENAIERDRIEIFCQEYVITLNGSDAAIKAGYEPKNARFQASRLLTKANVLTRVGELMKERADRLKLDAGFVLEQLLEVYTRCMEKKPVMVWSPEDKMMVQQTNEDGGGVWQFDSIGALKALEMIGKHLKMFTDKKEIAGADGMPINFKVDYGG